MSKKMNLEYVNNSAMKAMKALPKEIALQFATDLQRVQEGKSPLSDFKHLKGIGQGGVIELIENGSPAYRAVYCAKIARIHQDHERGRQDRNEDGGGALQGHDGRG
ncbi:type II toxin-antitoxin system RelE/ParE family toxin [Rhizobium ruizarguesonis]|jgi:phage-related protein|uniref:type II toxin-antitoxin system RelE/ParE family toxin n=1 Tax=Rhizobium ruizarguesonis TaxID=2081791 RepID=UPI001FDFAAD7|nr:type II toxin-antitoxin system RelE/ParE family toxin [Rhizobium ruizarguesonis]